MCYWSSKAHCPDVFKGTLQWWVIIMLSTNVQVKRPFMDVTAISGDHYIINLCPTGTNKMDGSRIYPEQNIHTPE